jgi:hypothetical protein
MNYLRKLNKPERHPMQIVTTMLYGLLPDFVSRWMSKQRKAIAL